MHAQKTPGPYRSGFGAGRAEAGKSCGKAE